MLCAWSGAGRGAKLGFMVVFIQTALVLRNVAWLPSVCPYCRSCHTVLWGFGRQATFWHPRPSLLELPFPCSNDPHPLAAGGSGGAGGAAEGQRCRVCITRCPCSHDLQALAAEVVALEEQVLQLKSSHLRDRSQASGASEVARAMQVRLGG